MSESYRPEGMVDAFSPPASGSGGTGSPATVKNLGWRGWARFVWRQLTSMRVALLLLMLLAVAAIPGSVIPQRAADPRGYAQYLVDHADRVDWMNRLQLFDVYSSVWFSAIYILLFVSLIGCILPRTRVHLRAMRALPPRAPRNFERLPAHVHVVATSAVEPDASSTEAGTAQSTDAAMADRARAYLRRFGPGRYRVLRETAPDGTEILRAEKGYLRESGNLLFHVALVGILVSVAIGQLYHYRGQVILTEGKGFANAQVDYNTFEAGAWFDPANLYPFRMTLDDFEAVFRASDAKAQDFTAKVTVDDDGRTSQRTIKVNHPLNIGGAKVYLQGNGYAPQVEVKDSDGNVAFAGAVPFIPQDEVYTSQGTIKVPDVTSGDQFGMVGYLLPTAEQSESGAWRSIYPQPLDPVLVLTVWRGDLGLDDGIPQNVYQLDTSNMQAVTEDGKTTTLVVRAGETVQLPDGLGELTFAKLDRYVALDLRHDPTTTYVLVSALVAIVGLTLSLFVPRRRIWLKVKDGDVQAAGLARTEDGALPGAVRSLANVAAFGRASGEPPEHTGGPDEHDKE